MKNIEYTFKELVNSDFWNEFYSTDRNGIECLQNSKSKITLGIKTQYEFFDDLFGFYYSSDKVDKYFNPKFIKVAECSDMQAADDLNVVVTETEIIVENLHCTKVYPGFSKDVFVFPLNDEQRNFVKDYQGLNYEDNLSNIEESREYIIQGSYKNKDGLYVDSNNDIVYNRNKAAVFKEKKAAEKALKEFTKKTEGRAYKMSLQESRRRTNRMKENDNGWGQEVQDILEELLEDFHNFSYEITNCERGAFTNATDIEGLRKVLKLLAEECEEKAENLLDIEE